MIILSRHIFVFRYLAYFLDKALLFYLVLFKKKPLKHVSEKYFSAWELFPISFSND